METKNGYKSEIAEAIGVMTALIHAQTILMKNLDLSLQRIADVQSPQDAVICKYAIVKIGDVSGFVKNYPPKKENDGS
jgi:hypothetical protein